MMSESLNQLTDQQIVDALLKRDRNVTVNYLYKKCYPLFNAIYNHYHTDCTSCIEFINDIYVYIMTPGPKTGCCKLETFGFRCTLTMWLKIVAEKYCYKKYGNIIALSGNLSADSDRFKSQEESLDMDLRKINLDDIEKLLNLMPNLRYRKLIRYKYLEEKSHEETADLLDINMANYYNKHRLAKAQFCDVLRKEGLL